VKTLTPQSRVLAFGEIMMRLTPPAGRRLEQAVSFDAWYGGAEANAAASLAYQGDTAAFVSVVPPNRLGDQALRYLAGLGVDVSRVVRGGDRLGVYFFENGGSGRPNGCVYDRRYSAMNLAAHTVFDWDRLFDGVDAFLFSGVTPAISDEMALACGEAVRAARAKGLYVVCDVNYRARLWSEEKARRVMTELLPFVDTAIAHDEDASAALGIDLPELGRGIDAMDAYVAADREIIRRFGCGEVLTVVRDIECVDHARFRGFKVDAQGGLVTTPIRFVHPSEGVGGGDAFSAGYLHARLHGLPDPLGYAFAACILKFSFRGDALLMAPDEIARYAAGAVATPAVR